MPAWSGELGLPGGHRAIVQRLDRRDLAALGPVIPDWMRRTTDDAASFDDDGFPFG